MQTVHNIKFGLAQNMTTVADASVALVVTSPPYPMIEMWDESFAAQDTFPTNRDFVSASTVSKAIQQADGATAFDLMHRQLEKVWDELARVTMSGGFVCINIGDATRTLDGHFALYSNHSRIVNAFVQRGFSNLPTSSRWPGDSI